MGFIKILAERVLAIDELLAVSMVTRGRILLEFGLGTAIVLVPSSLFTFFSS